MSNSYENYDGFVFRTPVFPIESIGEVPREPEELINFIRLKWENKLVRDALLLASPSVYRQIEISLKENKLPEGLAGAFLKYYLRMAFRCTPFGLFAGIGGGQISNITDIRLKDPEKHLLSARLDMEFLGRMIFLLSNNPDIRAKLLYQNNTSLYKVGAQWRYIEVFFKGDKKKYRIVSVDQNEILNALLDVKIARPYADLISAVNEYGYSLEISKTFVDDLIDSQILVPEIFPNLSGGEFHKKIAGSLAPLESGFKQIRLMLEISSAIGAFKKPGDIFSNYDYLLGKAKEINPDVNPSHFIQADLNLHCNGKSLGKSISNRILLGIRIMKALSLAKPNTLLDDFKIHFMNRFGSREVPLSRALDSEYGAGLFGPEGQQAADLSPLLDDMDFPIAEPAQGEQPVNRFLQRLISERWEEGSEYIYLNKEDLKRLNLRKGDWPNQLFALCRLGGGIKDNTISIDLASSGNPSHILGRFGYLKDEKLNTHTREMIQDDISFNEGILLADIVHLPEDRTGNILQRPSLYDFEITYLASPGGVSETIRADEILVSASQNRIVLKHNGSGKQIVPRLSNAHNYKSSRIPVYRFLAEYAGSAQNQAYFPAFGKFRGMENFTPGLRYENIILQPPIWKVKVDKNLSGNNISKKELYDEILGWVRRNELPDQVVWVNGDHEMLVNWSNYNIVMAFWDNIRSRSDVVFKSYPFEGGCFVRGSGYSYANEILVTYRRTD